MNQYNLFGFLAGIGALMAVVACRTIADGADDAKILVSMTNDNSESFAQIKCIDTLNLSYPDSVYIGAPSHIYATDDMFVIVDNRSQPYGFSHKGEYMCRYGCQGEAPSDFVNMGACAVCNNEVVICDSYTQRMLFYDLHSGQFNRDIAFPEGSLNMVQQCVFLNGTKALLARYVFNTVNSTYAVANIDDKTVYNFATVAMKTDNVAIPIGWHAISTYKDTAVYIKPFSPYIYQYPESKWIYIEQPRHVYDNNKLASINDFSIMTYARAISEGDFAGFTDIFELNDWIFLAMQDVEFYLINKRSWEMNTYKYGRDGEMKLTPITRIIGAIPQTNVLVGVNNQADDDKVYLYRLNAN